MHAAFGSGNIEIVMYLIGKGANLNERNKNGHTPLAYGTKNLLEKLNLKDGVCSSNRKMRKLMFRRGKRLDNQIWNNNRLLHDTKNKKIIPLMIDHTFVKYTHHPYTDGTKSFY